MNERQRLRISVATWITNYLKKSTQITKLKSIAMCAKIAKIPHNLKRQKSPENASVNQALGLSWWTFNCRALILIMDLSLSIDISVRSSLRSIALFLANVNSRFTFAICYRPSVCRLSVVCLSVVCNVRAPYSGGSNFRQYFYGIRYLGHPRTSTENFTEIVPGKPLRRGSWTQEG